MPIPRSDLRLRKLMKNYYAKAKLSPRAMKPLAWVTGGAPVEILIAMGITPIYPENHGAMIGAAKAATELTGEADRQGYSRDLCSYFRVDIGQSVLKKSPVGGLPRPDFLLCCNNVCGTVMKWYEAQSRYYGAPMIFLDTPFNYEDNVDRSVVYVVKQFEEIIPQIEKVSRRRFKWNRFRKALRNSADAISLWNQILSMAENRPAPLTCFDAFIHLAPIVTLRGSGSVIDYYTSLKKELEENIKKGIFAVENEKYRLLWDNLPVWHKMRKLSRVFSDHDAALVADTYTNAWASCEINPSGDMEMYSRVYCNAYLNLNAEARVQTFVNLARRFSADGIIIHSNRSCKPYSFLQNDIREEVGRRTGLPSVVIESDMIDESAFSEGQTLTRIQAFIETIRERKLAS